MFFGQVYIKWEVRCQKTSALNFFFYCFAVFKLKQYAYYSQNFVPKLSWLNKIFPWSTAHVEELLCNYLASQEISDLYGHWNFIIVLAKAPPHPTTNKAEVLWNIFQRDSAKLQKATIGFVVSVHLCVVCPHGTTRIPLDRFSWNLVFWQE